MDNSENTRALLVYEPFTRERLRTLVREGNAQSIQDVLESMHAQARAEEVRALLTQEDSSGNTLFLMAAFNSSPGVITLLMKEAYDLTIPVEHLHVLLLQPNVHQITPLMCAANNGYTAPFQDLLGAAYSGGMARCRIQNMLTQVTQDGNSLLMFAARSGNKDIVTAFLIAARDAGFTETQMRSLFTHTSEQEDTLLHWAAQSENPEAIETIMVLMRSMGRMTIAEIRAQLEQCNKYGATAMKYIPDDIQQHIARVLLGLSDDEEEEIMVKPAG